MRRRVSTITYQQEMCTQVKIACNTCRACSADWEPTGKTGWSEDCQIRHQIMHQRPGWWLVCCKAAQVLREVRLEGRLLLLWRAERKETQIFLPWKYYMPLNKLNFLEFLNQYFFLSFLFYFVISTHILIIKAMLCKIIFNCLLFCLHHFQKLL